MTRKLAVTLSDSFLVVVERQEAKSAINLFGRWGLQDFSEPGNIRSGCGKLVLNFIQPFQSLFSESRLLETTGDHSTVSGWDFRALEKNWNFF